MLINIPVLDNSIPKDLKIRKLRNMQVSDMKRL